LPNGNISTIAGSGSGGYNGDNIRATLAQLNTPYSVFVTSTNVIYIADTSNYRIRMISPNGNITTLAGTGVQGFSVDNIQATSSYLYSLSCIFVTSDNVIYINDYTRIRVISPDGIISTVPGTNNNFYIGSFSILPSKSIFISDTNTNRILIISSTGIASYLNIPGSYSPSIFVSLDNIIYTVDANNHRIRKVSPIGIISTIAGIGIAGYNGDNLPATSATLNYPNSIFVTLDNVLYIADTNNHRIRGYNNIKYNIIVFCLFNTCKIYIFRI
jgi:hypothetical protein